MHDEDMLQEVHGIAQRILKEEGTDAMELDDKAHDETRFKLLAKAIEAVFAAMQLQHHREHTEGECTYSESQSTPSPPLKLKSQISGKKRRKK